LIQPKIVAVYTTEALILKTKDYGEADRILTVFTKDRGKIGAIAKGVRRMESRKGGNVDQLNYVLVSLAEGRDLHVVTEVESLASFHRLKNELNLAVLGYYVAELIDRFFADEQVCYSIFRSALMTLSRLDKRSSFLRKILALRLFELDLLEELGFNPQFRSCVICGLPIRHEGCVFDASQGGVICRDCAVGRRGGIAMELETLRLIRNLQSRAWNDVKRVHCLNAQLNQVGDSLKYYLEWLLERKFGSLELLSDISCLEKINGSVSL